MPSPPAVDLAAMPDVDLDELANGLANVPGVPAPELDPVAACTAGLMAGAGAATHQLREVLRQAAARDHLRELMQRAVAAGVRMRRSKQGKLEFVVKGTVDAGLMAELHQHRAALAEVERLAWRARCAELRRVEPTATAPETTRPQRAR